MGVYIMSNKKVIMIGATGFIGSKIAKKLLERNCQL